MSDSRKISGPAAGAFGPRAEDLFPSPFERAPKGARAGTRDPGAWVEAWSRRSGGAGQRRVGLRYLEIERELACVNCRTAPAAPTPAPRRPRAPVAVPAPRAVPPRLAPTVTATPTPPPPPPAPRAGSGAGGLAALGVILCLGGIAAAVALRIASKSGYTGARNVARLESGDYVPRLGATPGNSIPPLGELISIDSVRADPEAQKLLAASKTIGDQGRKDGLTARQIAEAINATFMVQFRAFHQLPPERQQSRNFQGERLRVLLALCLQEAGIESRLVRGRPYERGPQGDRILTFDERLWIEVDVKGDRSYSIVIDPHDGIVEEKRNVTPVSYDVEVMSVVEVPDPDDPKKPIQDVKFEVRGYLFRPAERNVVWRPSFAARWADRLRLRAFTPLEPAPAGADADAVGRAARSQYRELRNVDRLETGDYLPGGSFKLGVPSTYERELIRINFGEDSQASPILQAATTIGAEGRKNGLTPREIADAVTTSVNVHFSTRRDDAAAQRGRDQTVGLFFKNGGCCRHRSALLQMCLQNAGVPSRYVRGALATGGPHAWVEVDVKGDGSYAYLIDPMRGISGLKKKDFPIGEESAFGVEGDKACYIVNLAEQNVVWRPSPLARLLDRLGLRPIASLGAPAEEAPVQATTATPVQREPLLDALRIYRHLEEAARAKLRPREELDPKKFAALREAAWSIAMELEKPGALRNGQVEPRVVRRAFEKQHLPKPYPVVPSPDLQPSPEPIDGWFVKYAAYFGKKLHVADPAHGALSPSQVEALQKRAAMLLVAEMANPELAPFVTEGVTDSQGDRSLTLAEEGVRRIFAKHGLSGLKPAAFALPRQPPPLQAFWGSFEKRVDHAASALRSLPELEGQEHEALRRTVARDLVVEGLFVPGFPERFDPVLPRETVVVVLARHGIGSSGGTLQLYPQLDEEGRRVREDLDRRVRDAGVDPARPDATNAAIVEAARRGLFASYVRTPVASLETAEVESSPQEQLMALVEAYAREQHLDAAGRERLAIRLLGRAARAGAFEEMSIGLITPDVLREAHQSGEAASAFEQAMHDALAGLRSDPKLLRRSAKERLEIERRTLFALADPAYAAMIDAGRFDAPSFVQRQVRFFLSYGEAVTPEMYEALESLEAPRALVANGEAVVITHRELASATGIPLEEAQRLMEEHPKYFRDLAALWSRQPELRGIFEYGDFLHEAIERAKHAAGGDGMDFQKKPVKETRDALSRWAAELLSARRTGIR